MFDATGRVIISIDRRRVEKSLVLKKKDMENIISIERRVELFLFTFWKYGTVNIYRNKYGV